MARRLIVERETSAVVADLGDSFGELDPCQGLRVGRDIRSLCEGAYAGFKRIARKHVQDIGEDQFLMLLLVIQAQLDQPVDARRQRARGP